MVREDTYSVNVQVSRPDGTWLNLGTAEKKSGGATDSEDVKVKLGGLQGELALGSSRTVENVTVSYLYVQRIHDQAHFLHSRVGKADVIVTVQPLDGDGNVNGRSIIYPGKLKSFTLPDVDAESSDAAYAELEITCHNNIA